MRQAFGLEIRTRKEAEGGRTLREVVELGPHVEPCVSESDRRRWSIYFSLRTRQISVPIMLRRYVNIAASYLQVNRLTVHVLAIGATARS